MSATSPLGFVYVLSNPAMPGQLKIGQTTRRPEERALELSRASGVPVPFELQFSLAFEDAALAERLVHQRLQEMGVRTSSNREFFEIEVELAVACIKGISEMLTTKDRVDELINTLTNQASYLLELGSLSNQEKALTSYEYAWQLGGLEQGYLAAELALELSVRKSTGSYRQKAWDLFEKTGQEGVARSYAMLARMALQDGSYTAASRNLKLYAEMLPPRGVPSSEVEFIGNELLTTWKSTSVDLSALRPLRSALLKWAKSNKSPDYDWLSSKLLTTQEQSLERYKYIVVGTLVTLLLYHYRPDLVFMGAIAAGVFLLWRRSRKAKAAVKRKK